jgi:hypothetical protein
MISRENIPKVLQRTLLENETRDKKLPEAAKQSRRMMRQEEQPSNRLLIAWPLVQIPLVAPLAP